MAGAVRPCISVVPTRGLMDEKFTVVVENLSPMAPVTLHCLHQSEDKDYWEAFGHYYSDSKGTVNVSEDASFGGTYTGTEPMGLLWSLRPVPGSRTGLRLRKMRVDMPMVVVISVSGGHEANAQPPVASVVAERWYMAPGVRRMDVREGGVVGTFFFPPGPGPFPGVLDMWGGGGGLVEYRAALLASHGFATMAIKYLDQDEKNQLDLRNSDAALLEMDYFETAFQIIREHPLVISDRVGILGLSLGTVVTIILAAYSKVVSPRCCVCISGGHVYISSPGSEANRNRKRDDQNRVIGRDRILPIPKDPSLKVDVGRIRCPMLLIVGGDDQNWATKESAEDMANMMSAAGNGHLLTTVTYPNTGHLIEPPFTPLIRASNFILHDTKEKLVMLWGGQTKPHADAQEDSWKKILAFLWDHLYRRPDTVPQSKHPSPDTALTQPLLSPQAKL